MMTFTVRESFGRVRVLVSKVDNDERRDHSGTYHSLYETIVQSKYRTDEESLLWEESTLCLPIVCAYRCRLHDVEF